MNDVQLLPLAVIHRDERAWPRDGLDMERVEDFARLYRDGGPFALDPVQVILPPVSYTHLTLPTNREV